MRSLLFNLAFYIVVPLWLFITLPMLLAPRRIAERVIYGDLSRILLWLLKVIVGLGIEVRGLENLRKGPLILAVKHQSTWDTFALTPYLEQPAMILKSELMHLPILGWTARGLQMIPVERGKGGAAVKHLVKEARKRAEDGREIFIFPEGHRMPVGAPPNYRRGIVALYNELELPVIPVALNSGLYWQRRAFTRRPGTVLLEFMPAIEPGLEAADFIEKLENTIEPATNRLIEEALNGDNPPPVPESYQLAREAGTVAE
jgi:1-acyl-sn-glycerol-3-phosphate acyltransferase